MEKTVESFLIDIVNGLHLPVQIGPNRYTVNIRYSYGYGEKFMYIGDKTNIFCEQMGQKIRIWVHHPKEYSWFVNLADPDSRETITNIFRTN